MKIMPIIFNWLIEFTRFISWLN